MNTGTSPFVSIVLPTYKRAHMLAHAIRSVLAQTWTNWELIVVDDCSPDDTAQVMASFSDPRIRYLRNALNLRLPRTLNRGHSVARGDYLTWTSDDNLYAPGAIETMARRLQQGDCDLVYADYWLFSQEDASGKPLDPQVDRLPDTVQLDKGNHMGACFLYTRQLYETVGEYDSELFLVEDYDFFIRASKRFCFAHIAEPLYYFRRDEDTLYLSRFAEVKASDVLVRYKNDLLDERGVIDTLVGLLLRHPDQLAHPGLRALYRLAKGRSYRLEQLQRFLAHGLLERRLTSAVHEILQRYRAQTSSFSTARDALRAQITRLGTLEYAHP